MTAAAGAAGAAAVPTVTDPVRPARPASAVEFGVALVLLAIGSGLIAALEVMLFGYLGDRLGRKYTFLATIVLMGLATAGVGLTPSAASIGVAAPVILIVLRMAQGLALGGEYGDAAVYVAEHAPDNKRGLYTSFIQTTATLGLFAALLIVIGIRTVIGEEADPAYDRVGLSAYVGAWERDALHLDDARHSADPRVTVRSGRLVTAIDTGARRVELDSGEYVDYDTLVLATGSRAFVPPVPGHDLPGCHVYRTLDDLDALLTSTAFTAEDREALELAGEVLVPAGAVQSQPRGPRRPAGGSSRRRPRSGSRRARTAGASSAP